MNLTANQLDDDESCNDTTEQLEGETMDKVKVGHVMAERQGQQMSAPQVLIVDDEMMNIEVMNQMVSTIGNTQSDYALTGQQAINKIEKRLCDFEQRGVLPYRVFLLDYSMPEMNGPELAVKIIELVKERGHEKP